MKPRRKLKFFNVGCVPNLSGEPHSSEVPIEVYVASGVYSRPIYIVQGCGHGLMGGFFSVKELEKPEVGKMLQLCRCEWISELLKNDIPENELQSIIFRRVGYLNEKLIDVRIE